MKKTYDTGPCITSVKRSTLKAKVTKHYKKQFGLRILGSGDTDAIEWATQMIQDLYPAAVKRETT